MLDEALSFTTLVLYAVHLGEDQLSIIFRVSLCAYFKNKEFITSSLLLMQNIHSVPTNAKHSLCAY